jgi:hypothetical protein
MAQIGRLNSPELALFRGRTRLHDERQRMRVQCVREHDIGRRQLISQNENGQGSGCTLSRVSIAKSFCRNSFVYQSFVYQCCGLLPHAPSSYAATSRVGDEHGAEICRRAWIAGGRLNGGVAGERRLGGRELCGGDTVADRTSRLR